MRATLTRRRLKRCSADRRSPGVTAIDLRRSRWSVATSMAPEEKALRRYLRAQALVFEILDVCKDEHSRASYLRMARTYPEHLVREALSVTKDKLFADAYGRAAEPSSPAR
jgi:hypothetical protein